MDLSAANVFAAGSDALGIIRHALALVPGPAVVSTNFRP